MEGARGFQGGGAAPEERERGGLDGGEEDLELGLSLGAGAKKGRPRGGRRILTAKDLRSLASSLPSTSVCSSSSSTSASGGAATAARRVASIAGGVTSPPSQAVVGWPPIRAFRINTLVNQSRDNFSGSDAATAPEKNNHNKIGRREGVGGKDLEKKAGHAGTSCFIKVNMDGDPIGRKVDLNAHQSYQTLVLSLEAMFHKPTMASGTAKHGAKASKLLDGSSEFALTYKDKDGDWMLVGDVPWGMFLDTVKRLRIMRTADVSGLGPSRFPITDKSAGLVKFEPA